MNTTTAMYQTVLYEKDPKGPQKDLYNKGQKGQIEMGRRGNTWSFKKSHPKHKDQHLGGIS